MRLRSSRPGLARLGIAAVCVVLLGGMGYRHMERSRLEAALVREPPNTVIDNPALVRLSLELARPAYASHCAGCHGRDLRGSQARGIPNLTDAVWLYGFGDVSDIETTILYGIRSGHPKSRNITDMPAFGRIGQLTPAEIHDVVEFVYSLSHRDYDAAAAKRGFALFNDKGACYDCHGADASGNIDYGAPDLTGKSWLYGGDRGTLTETVFDGRHGLCPAWISRLQPAQVRALAVYLYVSSHPSHGAASR